MAESSLAELLEVALPGGPTSLRHAQGGADALAAALFCMMVRDGYVALDRSGQPLPGYSLPQEWNAVPNLWAFLFSRPGAARLFRLECGQHPATRRMIVHASELGPDGAPLPENMQVMGVQADNYVRLGKAEGQQPGGSWHGVITSEATLCDMWDEFVASPLWRKAEKAAPSSTPRGAHGGSSWAVTLTQAVQRQRHVLLPAAAVVGAIAVGVLFYSRRQAA